jgi:hypothetical protein
MPLRPRSVGYAAATALVGFLAGAGAPAFAQPGPMLEAEASLADGRVAQVFTFGDGLGYRLDVDGALWRGQRDGEPSALVVADIDGDGAEDLTVVIAAEPDGTFAAADVWDVTTEGPMLMHASESITDAEEVAVQLEREVRDRLSLDNALFVLELSQDAADDGETPPAMTNWLAIVEGALLHASVARAREALAAAAPDDVEAARDDLHAALEARAEFAATTASQIYD